MTLAQKEKLVETARFEDADGAIGTLSTMLRSAGILTGSHHPVVRLRDSEGNDITTAKLIEVRLSDNSICYDIQLV